VWAFIRARLDRIDFRGKSFLDIGAWDGCWSFYAEQHGARDVLATDDNTQNWGGGAGIHLARELLDSRIRINQNASVYNRASLGETFDIILFMGGFYHLFDPFYALTQIRRCCRPDTLVLMEGAVSTVAPPGDVIVNFGYTGYELLATIDALRQMVRAAYFEEVDFEVMKRPENGPAPAGRPPEPPNQPPAAAPRRGIPWLTRLRLCMNALAGRKAAIRRIIEDPPPAPPPAPSAPPASPLINRINCERVFLVCRPFEGTNELYPYRPVFGLDQYDSRYRDA
jgi:SAM-dependent methyltransferase